MAFSRLLDPYEKVPIILGAVSTASVNILELPTAPPPASVSIAVRGDGIAVVGGEKGKTLITRTGNMSNDLTVFYKVKGSAVNGVDYETLPGSVLIPAGVASVKVKIKPLADPAQTDPVAAKIQLLAPADGSYTLGTAAKAKIKIFQ